jgi:hypothetical protein
MGEAKRRKAAVVHDDDSHCDLVNSFIDFFNRAHAAGYHTDFVASAAEAAAAAYVGFNISQAMAPITDEDLDLMASQYRYRMLDFMQEKYTSSLSDKLRSTPATAP